MKGNIGDIVHRKNTRDSEWYIIVSIIYYNDNIIYELENKLRKYDNIIQISSDSLDSLYNVIRKDN